MTTFRVHFTDGDVIDVPAPSPTAARTIALERKGDGFISKIKVLKGA